MSTVEPINVQIDGEQRPASTDEIAEIERLRLDALGNA